MVSVKDLVEDWIEIRTTLLRQLALLRDSASGDIDDTTAKSTLARIEKMVGELNTLLKEFASAHRT